MILVTIAKQGIREVWSHKFRSFLSMIGIILGVASLVAMIGVVQGMIRNFTVFFEETGGIEKVTITSKEPPESQSHIAFLSPGLSLSDVEAIQASVPLAEYVTPQVEFGWTRIVRGSRRMGNRVQGVTSDIQLIENYPIARGRFVGDLDNLHARPVAVIGAEVVRRLYEPDEDPLGSQIRIKNQPFTVIGILEDFEFDQNGRNALRWKNWRVFIPSRTAAQRFRGDETVSEILLKVSRYEDLRDLIPQVENVLLQRHNGIEDFEIQTREEQLAEFEKLENSFTYSLGGVAGISLLVGGIGIMNVMLAVVSERIREIGVRKAVGARASDIFFQFLVESTVISVIGGIFGIVLSVGFLQLLSAFIPGGANINLFPGNAMIFGFAFSAAVGVFSGLYPALKAARLDPIEALRYE
ncbi:ABC transporter permease [Puniceicoccus vermicola]|uniref:ABC transporter permease n=1 Tax=Puniceicoccus vermicola TaxID=388746 RepID=A0A7X1B2D0_9BACT|nr:ABC transporter permease [Puniceicoccus vermicola]MBC2604272.1 ABC transporter permease [Puniceicoccus vermicola]